MFQFKYYYKYSFKKIMIRFKQMCCIHIRTLAIVSVSSGPNVTCLQEKRTRVCDQNKTEPMS